MITVSRNSTSLLVLATDNYLVAQCKQSKTFSTFLLEWFSMSIGVDLKKQSETNEYLLTIALHTKFNKTTKYN